MNDEIVHNEIIQPEELKIDEPVIIIDASYFSSGGGNNSSSSNSNESIEGKLLDNLNVKSTEYNSKEDKDEDDSLLDPYDIFQIKEQRQLEEALSEFIRVSHKERF